MLLHHVLLICGAHLVIRRETALDLQVGSYVHAYFRMPGGKSPRTDAGVLLSTEGMEGAAFVEVIFDDGAVHTIPRGWVTSATPPVTCEVGSSVRAYYFFDSESGKSVKSSETDPGVVVSMEGAVEGVVGQRTTTGSAFVQVYFDDGVVQAIPRGWVTNAKPPVLCEVGSSVRAYYGAGGGNSKTSSTDPGVVLSMEGAMEDKVGSGFVKVNFDDGAVQTIPRGWVTNAKPPVLCEVGSLVRAYYNVRIRKSSDTDLGVVLSIQHDGQMKVRFGGGSGSAQTIPIGWVQSVVTRTICDVVDGDGNKAIDIAEECLNPESFITLESLEGVEDVVRVTLAGAWKGLCETRGNLLQFARGAIQFKWIGPSNSEGHADESTQYFPIMGPGGAKFYVAAVDVDRLAYGGAHRYTMEEKGTEKLGTEFGVIGTWHGNEEKIYRMGC